MVAIMLNGFLTGLILQIAIGPVFFFILNISLQKTVIDGLFAISAVTLVDYIFIALAVLGVGKLLEKPKIKHALGIISSLVLILFGIIMILLINHSNPVSSPNNLIESNSISSFISAFILTISSPLTIVFWTSLFATKAIEKGYAQKQLIFFGIAAGLATLVFLGSSVTLLSIFRASIPLALLRVLNTAVGLLLIIYGVIRLCKIAINR
ncbi:MAG: LysE family transporter [Desulfobacterales bacterium]|nr:LysE family transporter [Desulfobacterales bacterium]